MDIQDFTEKLANLANQAKDLSDSAAALASQSGLLKVAAETGGSGQFMSYLTVFVLAVFVGYYVVWRVTPALHSPLMAVTNAVSSVIIVGALVAAGPAEADIGSRLMGFFAVILASVNIFGGFVVTQRMLAMFKKKQK